MGAYISEDELNEIGQSLSGVFNRIREFIKKKWNDIYNRDDKQHMQ